MRIDPKNVDKFAALYRAGRKARGGQQRAKGAGKLERSTPTPAPNVDHSYDDTIPPGTRLYKTQRERQIEAIERDRRMFKRAMAIQQSRLARIASEVSAARRFFKTLKKIEPETAALGFDDVDADVADLARRLDLQNIENDYDRFSVFEVGFRFCRRVAARDGFTEPDPATYFETRRTTSVDELKEAMNIR